MTAKSLSAKIVDDSSAFAEINFPNRSAKSLQYLVSASVIRSVLFSAIIKFCHESKAMEE